jgi:hypothetical protein
MRKEEWLSYNDICKEMGEEPISGGRSRNNQLKKWRVKYDVLKEGKKYYIAKEYTPEEIMITDNQSKFTRYIENALIKTLYDCSKKHQDYVVLTNKDILEMTYMVNKNYFKGRSKPYEFVKEISEVISDKDSPQDLFPYSKAIEETQVFFSASYRLLKRVIYDCLNSMVRKSLIQKSPTFRLYKNWTDKDEIHHCKFKDCDEKELDRILSVQYRSVKEFNAKAEKYENGANKYFLKNFWGIGTLYPREKKEFFKILSKNFQEEFKEEGWNAYSNAWKINLSHEDCFQYEVQRMNYQALNQNVQDKLSTAKDLDIIGNVIKSQLIKTFIQL